MKPKKEREMRKDLEIRALEAVSSIQRRSKELGLDNLSKEEIEAEIKAVRKHRASQSNEDEF